MSDTTWSTAVGNYYDETTNLYISHIGPIFQAGSLVENGQVLDLTASVGLLALRAGIVDGTRILDAGCGICGPSITIAKKFKHVTIEAITNSSHQVEIAKQNIIKNKLSERIKVNKADFHKTPFPENSFDTILFFESFGHSQDFEALLKEIYRILKPGGYVYIKDVFHHPVKSNIQNQELTSFNKEFFYNTPDMSAVVDIIHKVNFELLKAVSIDSSISHEFFKNAIYQIHENNAVLTKLGEKHPVVFTDLPIYFGEILIKKI